MADRGRRYLLLADEDLVSLAEGGDAGAFAGLYDRHSRAAYSLAFEPHDEGVAAMPIEGSLHDADAVAVTIEQYNGSPMPTSEPLLTATL